MSSSLVTMGWGMARNSRNEVTLSKQNFLFIKFYVVSANSYQSFEGGGPFEFPTPTPHPPPDPPKFLNPSFSNLRFWGKGSVPKKNLPFLRGYFFLPYVSILKILRICGEFKNV